MSDQSLSEISTNQDLDMTLSAHDRLRLRRDFAQTVAELRATTRDGTAPADDWISLLDSRTEHWVPKGTLSDTRDGVLLKPCAVLALNDEITTAAFRYVEATAEDIAATRACYAAMSALSNDNTIVALDAIRTAESAKLANHIALSLADADLRYALADAMLATT